MALSKMDQVRAAPNTCQDKPLAFLVPSTPAQTLAFTGLRVLTVSLKAVKPKMPYRNMLMIRKLASVPNTPAIKMDGRLAKKALFSTDSPQ